MRILVRQRLVYRDACEVTRRTCEGLRMIGFYQINLLDILVGLGLAWVVRWRWPWAPIAGIASAFAFNGIHDWISYGDALRHREQLIVDALAFSGWTIIFCLLRPYLAMLRRGNF